MGRRQTGLQFESVLPSAIEVGIGTAGFSGIVVVLGQRAQGNWSAADVGRIVLLLQGSFAAILLSFLALLLDGAQVAEPTIWRAGSGTFVVYALLILPLRARQIERMRGTDASFSPGLARALFPVVFACTALQAYNTVFLHAGWPFALAVMFELAVALLNFVRLLRTLWERA